MQNRLDSGSQIAPALQPDSILGNVQPEAPGFRRSEHGHGAGSAHHDRPDIMQHGGCKFGGLIITENASQTALHAARNRRLGENANRNAYRLGPELIFQPLF